MTDLVNRARLFACAAHAATGQVRKYTGEPYIVHPAAVAELVASVPHTEEMLAAAWLHDVVEDTAISLTMIADEFDVNVARMVSDLTDISCMGDGNREVRKTIDALHTSRASPETKTIKLADLIDNTKSIRFHDVGFWKVYKPEKMRLLEVLTQGDATLWRRAYNQVHEIN